MSDHQEARCLPTPKLTVRMLLNEKRCQHQYFNDVDFNCIEDIDESLSDKYCRIHSICHSMAQVVLGPQIPVLTRDEIIELKNLIRTRIISIASQCSKEE